MARHSPGPWKAFLAGKSSNLAIGRDIGEDTYIVLARVSEVITGVGTLEANASVMAAAPELLEALEFTLNALEALRDDCNWSASAISAKTIYAVNLAPGKARDAIAKARGSEGPVNE